MQAGWEDILAEGEEILWQGRPAVKLGGNLRRVPAMLFGLAFAGFALFWMIMASQAGGGFWMFGMIHFAVGLSLAFGAPFWARYRRQHTWYTLTNRRALIATDMPFSGRGLKSYPITESTVLDLQQTTPPSLYFDEEFRRSNKGSKRVQIGFEGIGDASEVMAYMHKIQRGET